MNAKRLIALLSCLCLLGLVSAPAGAVWTTEYDDLMGEQPGEVDFYNIDETSVTDPTPLFGAPNRTGNTLLFYPTAFASESLDGDPDTTQGKLRMRITTDPGTFFEQIIISEYGDYLLTGGGTSGTQANVGGTMQVTDESPGHFFPTVIQVPMEVTPVPPYALPEDSSGWFVASGEVDLTGYEWTQLYLVFTDTLQTTSEAGTASFIQKNVIHGPVALTVIPEPGCLWLLAVGAAAALKRRRSC